MQSGIRKNLSGVLIVCILFSGCGQVKSDDVAADPGIPATTGTALPLATTEPAFLETQLSAFESLRVMSGRSDIVALMTVENVWDGETLDVDHAGTSSQILAELTVDAAIKGSRDGESISVWIGIRETDRDGGPPTDLFTTRGYAPKVGDRLVVGLVADNRTPGLYGIESNDSFFVLGDGGDRFRQDIFTTNEKAREVRGRSVEDVLTDLRAR